jgi:hypothetical protein
MNVQSWALFDDFTEYTAIEDLIKKGTSSVQPLSSMIRVLKEYSP